MKIDTEVGMMCKNAEDVRIIAVGLDIVAVATRKNAHTRNVAEKVNHGGHIGWRMHLKDKQPLAQIRNGKMGLITIDVQKKATLATKTMYGLRNHGLLVERNRAVN